jgi:hypothetical protein
MAMGLRRALSFTVTASLLTLAGAAHADEPSRTSMQSDLLSYYEGERTSAYVATALGVVAAGAGGFLVTRSSDFARGLGWPLVALGALEAIGGIGYAFAVGGEIDHYSALLARDPAAFQREEAAHIAGTTSRFVYYRVTELVLLLGGAGLATYGFATKRDAWAGAGVGLASIALPIVIMDTINNTRAGRYADTIHRFKPTVALRAGSTGVTASLGGSF